MRSAFDSTTENALDLDCGGEGTRRPTDADGNLSTTITGCKWGVKVLFVEAGRGVMNDE